MLPLSKGTIILVLLLLKIQLNEGLEKDPYFGINDPDIPTLKVKNKAELDMIKGKGPKLPLSVMLRKAEKLYGKDNEYYQALKKMSTEAELKGLEVKIIKCT